MALTVIDYKIFSLLKERGIFPASPAVLEFGESQWYGDVDLAVLLADIPKHVPDAAAQARLTAEFWDIMNRAKHAQNEAERVLQSFALGKLFFRVFLSYGHMEAIDLHGTSFARKADLNYPVAFDRQFDLVMNLGTGEHVFNQFQFLETAHKAAKPGGLMIHEQPFTGWVEHGFYNFQPTFYYDIAAANGYEIVFLGFAAQEPYALTILETREDIATIAARGPLPANTLMFSVFRKPKEEKPFQMPYQGFYFGTMSQENEEAWRNLRG